MAPRSNRLMKSSEAMSPAQLADLLEGLAARIRGGSVTLKSGTEEVVLDLPGRVKVDVEVTEAQRRRGTKDRTRDRDRVVPGGIGDRRSGTRVISAT
ncbi:amphi-Trp domain-containing protein [Gordonia sp. (in: high G+C Gram-positive bacteria)]|uniref:amphi-Trp domain-containing protein n=1 Tax=Gordonia sp. (in: high G+C Gram-positive bacteria) TaxID=84139 RepID=UPI003C748778